MNDPKNWNIDAGIKSIEVTDAAMAKEMERRWNAYPGLISYIRERAKKGSPVCKKMLKKLGEEM